MNYELVMEKEIANLDYVPKLLLHACCAPCSSAVIEYLANYFEITILYYNPNIDTEGEFDKRINELYRFISEFKTKYPVKVINLGYLKNEYQDKIIGLENEPERGKRCLVCYKLRLEKSFKYALDNKFDYVTTTLTLSPLKNSQAINEIASELEEIYPVKYLYSDFKKKERFKRSIELSKEYNLYRQDYCGCLYSKRKNISD